VREPSLRLRLLVLSIISVALVVSIAGLSISTLFANHVQRSFERGLSTQLDRLIALVNPTPNVPKLRQPMPDARYETPGSGIYWQVTDPGTEVTIRSRSLWDTTLPLTAPVPQDNATSSIIVTDPAGGEALMIARTLHFATDAGERTLVVAVAEGTAAVAATNAAFQSDLLRALAILAVALIGTSWLQVRLGLAPLSIIKRGISAVRSGHNRTLGGKFPLEVMPLVSEVNELLSAQERSIRFARDRAADLAHGLKTNLTRLNVEAHHLREAGDDAAASRIEQLTAEMAQTIDHQLRLARLRHRTRTDGRTTPLGETLGKIIAAIRVTPSGEALDWQVTGAIVTGAIAPGATQLSVALDPMDLTELLGVVLENAAQWATSRVVISATEDKGTCMLAVEDDGKGLDPAAMASLGQRGRRLDEARPGSGIGLAIAREIVDLNAGSLEFSKSELGGLKVAITLRCAGNA
jgi:signal transduction histidine kinase